MPPLHPALVHFPIALTVTSVAADSLANALALPDLAGVGHWTILFAAAGALAAAAAGQRDMRLDKLKPTTHQIVHLHRFLGWTVVANLILLAVSRWGLGGQSLVYLIYGWLIVALVLLQAWLGGELVYAHGAGVAAADQGQQPAGAAQLPSLRFYRRLRRSDLERHGE